MQSRFHLSACAKNVVKAARISAWLAATVVSVSANMVMAVAPTNTSPTYIVLLDRSVDSAAFASFVGAKPSFVYHGKVHGFAAQLDTNTVAQLKLMPGFSVAPSPAPCIVSLPATADPKATAKAMGLHPKFIYGAWKKPAWFKGNQFKGFAVTLDGAGLARLDGDNRIADVEPDSGKVTVAGQAVPLGILRMGLTNFPVAQINGQDEWLDVDVAVLDTGIQIDTTNLATNTVFNTTLHGPHPDLPNVVHAVGFADPGYYGDDWDGHGTRMAGIIGAIGVLDGNTREVGVAPGVRLWSVQVLGPTEAAWANVLAGLDYIAQHADQIEVVNASIVDSSGNTPYSDAEQAVASIVNQGTVFVAAAGNSGMDVCGFDDICGTSDDVLPAALPEVLCVSGMDPSDDTMWSGSNYSLDPRATNFVTSPGLNIDLAAPGVGILSTTMNSSYNFADGTSDATAHVTGLVALYIAANGRATNAAGVYHIRQTLIDDGLPQTQWHPNGQPYDATNNPTGAEWTGHLAPLAIANEAWVPQPEFYGESKTTNGFALSFGTVPGYQYTVKYRDSLAATITWNSLIVTNGTGQLTTVTVGDPAPGDQRFYRLERTPAP